MFLNGWANGFRKRLQVDAIFVDVQSGEREIEVNIFFQKLLLPFLALPGRVEDTYSQFSRKLFSKFVDYLRIMLKVLEFYEMGGNFTDVAAQLSLYFPG